MSGALESRCRLCGAAHVTQAITDRCAAEQRFLARCDDEAGSRVNQVDKWRVRELAGHVRNYFGLGEEAWHVARIALALGWRPVLGRNATASLSRFRVDRPSSGSAVITWSDPDTGEAHRLPGETQPALLALAAALEEAGQ